MELKRFTGFDVECIDEDHDEDSEDLLLNDEYLDFLRQDGVSIKIRKIVYVNEETIHVYYDGLNTTLSTSDPKKKFNRFSDLEMV
jgi:hypothetical protein